jgi:hypothetical protein
VADLPTTYLNAVVQLFEFVSGEECFLNCPWFINTMGFCQGIVLNRIQPRDNQFQC